MFILDPTAAQIQFFRGIANNLGGASGRADFNNPSNSFGNGVNDTQMLEIILAGLRQSDSRQDAEADKLGKDVQTKKEKITECDMHIATLETQIGQIEALPDTVADPANPGATIPNPNKDRARLAELKKDLEKTREERDKLIAEEAITEDHLKANRDDNKKLEEEIQNTERARDAARRAGQGGGFNAGGPQGAGRGRGGFGAGNPFGNFGGNQGGQNGANPFGGSGSGFIQAAKAILKAVLALMISGVGNNNPFFNIAKMLAGKSMVEVAKTLTEAGMTEEVVQQSPMLRHEALLVDTQAAGLRGIFETAIQYWNQTAQANKQIEKDTHQLAQRA